MRFGFLLTGGLLLAPFPLRAQVAPIILTPPVSQTAAAGSVVAFSITATGTAPLTYQWAKDGSDLAGATNSVLLLRGITAPDAGSYSVVIRNLAGSATSNAVTLTLMRAPAIVIPPQGASVFTGAPVTLAATIDGVPAPTFQWRKDTVNLPGATNSTYPIASAALTDAGAYELVATNSVASVTTPSVAVLVTKRSQTITFATPVTTAVAGTGIALNATADSGLPVSFTLVSGTGSLAGSSLTGTGGTVVVRALQAGNGSFDAAASVDRTFSFIAGALSPFITSAPVDQTVLAGTAVTFRVSAVGSPPPAFQWQKDGAAIAGATTAALTLASAAIADTARYTVVATNAAGAAIASAALTVRAAPVIVTAPASATVSAGTPASFTVVATGAPTPTFQWRKNGTAITGATTTALNFASASSGDAGRYDVVVTNSIGTMTSAAATLTVNVSDFTGDYFGRFTGATGDFVLHVRSDGNAAFLGFLPVLQTGLMTLDLRVDPAGSFALGFSTLATSAAGPAPLAGQLTPPIAAATQRVTLTGSLNAITGVMTGRIPELAVTLAGTRAARTGFAAAQAGFYQAALVGSAAGRGYVVVAPDGKAFVLTASGANLDGTNGTVGSNGRLALTTPGGAAVDFGFSNGTLSGTVRSGGITGTIAGAAEGLAGTERLVNVSFRSITGTGTSTMITGFVITGTAAKQVLIRAAGPAIGVAPFNVPNVVADPTIEVLRGATAVAQNNDWGTPAANAAAITAAAARVGAFPFRAGSADSALLTTLTPGAYTVIIGGGNGATLAEVYEVLEAAELVATRRLGNLSARGVVSPGAPLIAGFVIGGTAPQRVLVRGIGPALTGAPFNIAGALANPQLTLFRGAAAAKNNDDWFRDPDATLIRDAAARAGAFVLGASSLDAAILIYLEPGAYTAQVSGPTNANAANGTGVGLIEVYEAPP